MIDDIGGLQVPEMFSGINKNIKEVNLKRNYISLEAQKSIIVELKKMNADLKVQISDQHPKRQYPSLEREEAYFNQKEIVDEALISLWVMKIL